MPTTKKKTKKVPSEVIDPLSSSGVSSLSGISSYNIRKIKIYKNGDRFHRGVKFVINPRVVKDLEPLLNQINDRIELSHGVKKLFTASGKPVKSIKELEDGQIYVAASSQYTPMSYGGFEEKVWKPPSRKHSPIFREDRIRTSRTRSQEPRQRQAARAMAAEHESQKSASSVVRSRSVRTLAEDRKSRKDVPNGRSAEPPKRVVQRKIPPPKVVSKSPAAASRSVKPTIPAKKPPVPSANRKPKTPKPKVEKKVEKPVQTAASMTPSECPPPNVASSAAEILEFPEEQKVVNVARIHRTPTPPRSPPKLVKSVSDAHSAAHSDDDDRHSHGAKSKSRSASESEAGTEEDEEASASDDDDHSKHDKSDEEHGDDEEESVGTDSEVETPSSRKSSSAVSSGEEEEEESEKEDKDKKDEEHHHHDEKHDEDKKSTRAESAKK